MTLKGHVENGVIVLDDSTILPDGTSVRIEVVPQTSQSAKTESAEPTVQKRVGGQYRDQIRIAPDFDELPEDLAQAFGMIDG